MTKKTTTRQPAEVFPPHVFIREEIEERGWSEVRAMDELQWGPLTFNVVIDGQIHLIPPIADDLARVFGTSPDYWLNLQRMYDEWIERSNK